MKIKIKNFVFGWWFFVLILLVQFTVLYFAPNEQTLGAGIKPVYLHVSLTWVGMLLFVIGAIMGAVVLFVRKGRLTKWHRFLFLTAVIFYSVGFLVSMYASVLNWGGIPFQEPRIRNAINVVVVGIAAWALNVMVNDSRVQGLVSLIPFGFILFAQNGNRTTLHPDNPVNSAPMSIRSTFLIMFALSFILSVWVFQRFNSNNHSEF